jgi:bifunctional N-acetylglucosamine-1-phosphate-uridyltransferase/glucosamine-1-phosphate-acetyltransferase GlmU-like protein
MIKAQDLFALDDFAHKSLFDVEYVWEVLKNIKGYIKETIKPNVDALRERGDVIPETVILHNDEVIDSDFSLNLGGVTKGEIEVKYKNEILKDATVVFAGSSFLSNDIELGKNTVIEPGALMKDGCLIGNQTEVRQGAYLRGTCLVGNRCVVGHVTEMKNSVMMDDSKAGHFAYIGDSILGNRVNLGAGTILANLKIVDSTIVLKIEKQKYETGLRKFGAIIGDNSETGCNTVTVPGTILGSNSMVFPNTTVHPGYHPPRSLVR